MSEMEENTPDLSGEGVMELTFTMIIFDVDEFTWNK